MSQPRRKRRKVDEPTTGSNTAKADSTDLTQLVRTIVAEAVPGIVKAVTESLSGLPAQQGTSTNEAPASVTRESATNVASTSNVSEQPGAEAQITTTPTGNFLNLTGPLHTGRPLSLTVDIKIKGKIWAEEFIQLGSLLFKSSQPKLQAIQGEDNQITFTQKEQKFYFKGFNQWLTAFQVFVAVYCEKFPEKAPALMKYMATIQKISVDMGEKAAYHYDEQFRLWRADNPQAMPWECINQELHAEALQIGVKQKLQAQVQDRLSKSKQPFLAKQPKKVCFSYNNNEGVCSRQNCTFSHICSRCHGNHHKKLCQSGNDGMSNEGSRSGGGGQTPKNGAMPSPATKSGQSGGSAKK